jgi:PKD repeat protein
MVYPWASGKDATFFDQYSVTRTVEELFGPPLLAGAATTPSLIGHFGLALPQPPTAAFTPSCTYLSCMFDSTASSPPLSSQTSYHWDFGDGSTGEGNSPGHAYAGAGTYTVTLVVTNALGASASTTRTPMAALPLADCGTGRPPAWP